MKSFYFFGIFAVGYLTGLGSHGYATLWIVLLGFLGMEIIIKLGTKIWNSLM